MKAGRLYISYAVLLEHNVYQPTTLHHLTSHSVYCLENMKTVSLVLLTLSTGILAAPIAQPEPQVPALPVVRQQSFTLARSF